MHIMRNNIKTKTILKLTSGLPYFTIDNLQITTIKREYLRIILSRLFKKGELIRIKKSYYVSRSYIDGIISKGLLNVYLEFISNIISSHSYLSLDYVLYENNFLTEMPKNFTLVSLNKTAVFSNKLGIFIYHKIKKRLFKGFNIYRQKEFFVYKASKAKALFDFVYFRKNLLPDKQSIIELRLNLEYLNNADIKEFKQYIKIEGSKKIKKIADWLLDRN